MTTASLNDLMTAKPSDSLMVGMLVLCVPALPAPSLVAGRAVEWVEKLPPVPCQLFSLICPTGVKVMVIMI